MDVIINIEEGRLFVRFIEMSTHSGCLQPPKFKALTSHFHGPHYLACMPLVFYIPKIGIVGFNLNKNIRPQGKKLKWLNLVYVLMYTNINLYLCYSVYGDFWLNVKCVKVLVVKRMWIRGWILIDKK
jgi:hypothetical protein